MPDLALAMYPGLDELLLGTEERARLDAVATVRGALALGETMAGVEVVLAGWGCPPLTAAVLAGVPDLRLVAYAGGSVRDFETPALWDAGVVVTTAAGANAVPVAEFTVAAIVFALKDVFTARDAYREGRGRFDRRALATPGTYGRRIGLVGASRVGRLVVGLLTPLDVEVAVADPYLSPGAAAALGARLMDLPALLAWADVVSLHAPALPQTPHLIGAAELAAMRPGAWLVNTARGAILDHHALADACAGGHLRAFLDTTDPEPLPPASPLWDLPGVVVTPHLAGSQGDELRRLGAAAVGEIERFAAGEGPLDPVRAEDLTRIA